jgi:hypothetical protein
VGYTHYFSQTQSFTREEWVEVSADIQAILTFVEHGCNVPLGDGYGAPGSRPLFDTREIVFNGIGDNAHETFAVPRVRGRSDFCKTDRKPYDLAVTACLCYLSSVTGKFIVGSDGHGRDFLKGLSAAREALPQKENLLDIPMGVMQRDRWVGPYIMGSKSSGYDVRFCIDGKGYVIKKSTQETCCFETHRELAIFLQENRAYSFRQGGSTRFGWYGREEPNIWEATGAFDEARHERIARAQARVLKTLFPVDAAHVGQPPAYVRPNEYPPQVAFYHTLDDLLRSVAA